MRKSIGVIVLCAIAMSSMIAAASAGVEYHGGPKSPATYTTQKP